MNNRIQQLLKELDSAIRAEEHWNSLAERHQTEEGQKQANWQKALKTREIAAIKEQIESLFN